MKRLTETEKWRDPWFQKLDRDSRWLWVWLCDRVDNSGVIDICWPICNAETGGNYSNASMEAFGDRIEQLSCGKWFVPKFVIFQFGELSDSPTNRVHQSVIKLLEKNNLRDRVSYRVYHTPKDKDKDKDKDNDLGKGSGENQKSRAKSFDDVLACGATTGASREFCEWFWNNYQSNGWIDGGTKLPIYDWKFKLSKLWIEQKAKENEKIVKTNGFHKTPQKSQQEIQDATAFKQEQAANAFKMEPSDIAAFCRYSVSNGDLARITRLSSKQYEYLLSIVSDKVNAEIQEKMNGNTQRTH